MSFARNPDNPYSISSNGPLASTRHTQLPEAIATPVTISSRNKDFPYLKPAQDAADVSVAQSSRVERKTTDFEERRRRRKVVKYGAEDSTPPRRGFQPGKALVIALKSSCSVAGWTNILLPAVPIGLVFHWLQPEWHTRIFAVNFLAMIPMANLLSFSAQELTRKMPRALGMVLETMLGAAVEIILCMLLLFKEQYQVIQAALLGSMLANLLLCTGLCFIIGGIRYKDQELDETVVETSGGLLLLSVVGLAIPVAFHHSISAELTEAQLQHGVLQISRVTGCLLLIAYALFLLFQLITHQSLYDTLLKESEEKKKKANSGSQKCQERTKIDHFLAPKLTTGEGIFFVVLSLTFVTLHAIFLVSEIHWIVSEGNVSDAFVGLILVPLVEKTAEHLTAVDEAWDNAMDSALSHLLGCTVQTALMVAPIIVIAGWIAGKDFNFDFDIYMIVVLVLSVLVVGNFLKDRKSNYLEGALCIILYLIITTSTWYYPNPRGG
ncbi:hypothetical protein RUND412_006450 [Rhizina undulata]